MDVVEAAKDVNVLGEYLARRDVEALTGSALSSALDSGQVDLLILFGGSILCGIDRAARAYQAGLTKVLMVAGGIGHTTQALRDAVAARYPSIQVHGRAEADIIADVLDAAYGIPRDSLLIENRSTNCGENAEFALAVARDAGLAPASVLFMQDSSMQRRMHETMRRAWGKGVRLLSYAAYRAEVIVRSGAPAFATQDIDGLWAMPRYISLLMGEIPRLRDDEGGYGPRGKGYIAHVDIPADVEAAFSRLLAGGAGAVRAPWEG